MTTARGIGLVVAALAAAPGGAAAAAPANDAFADALVLGAALAQVSGTNAEATKEAGEPSHAGNAGGRSVWYRWTAPAAGAVTVETCGSGFDTLLAVYAGSAVNALTQMAASDDACGLQSRVGFGAVAGTEYRIAVDGFGGASGSVELSLAQGSGPAAPSFSGTDPSSPADDTTPRILGSSEGGTTVRLYSDPSCVNQVGSGTASQFASPGIEVTVADGSTTTFRAKAVDSSNRESACSSGSITYAEQASGGGGGGGGTPPPDDQPPFPACEAGPTTYTGTHAEGGSVCFVLTADWTGLTRFIVRDVRGSNCTFGGSAVEFRNPESVTDRRFSFDGSLSASGTLDARAARGSFRITSSGGAFSASCSSARLDWTATTSGTPPWLAAAGQPAPGGQGAPAPAAGSQPRSRVRRACAGRRGAKLRRCRAAQRCKRLRGGRRRACLRRARRAGAAEFTIARAGR